MADFLQTLIVALTLGSLYALISLGYTMVYGILKLINFAHSDIVVAGAWFSVLLATTMLPRLGIDPQVPSYIGAALVLVGAMLLCGLMGFLIERFAYRPIRKAPRLNALITAIGVSLLLQNFHQFKFTIVSNETQIAEGKLQERGDNAKTVKLDQPLTLDADTRHVLRFSRPDAKPDSEGKISTSDRKISAPAGKYEIGSDVAIEAAIGRADTRGGAYKVFSVSPNPPITYPFGAYPSRIPSLLPDRKFTMEFESEFGSGASAVMIKKPVIVTLVDGVIVATTLFLIVALQMLVYRTKIGTAMRAVSFNMDTAALMGIPVNRVVSFTFVTGTMLAAAAGFLYALKYSQIQQPAHQTWIVLGLKAFVAAVVGGIGNLRGAAIGGFLIAFIEQFAAYIGLQAGWANVTAYTDVIVFLVLIFVLLVKPAGIFGSTVREKV
ncbi:MAG TPA: branched-chain amino acid ABC transporter permease [Tepidisphaeraceae bacterium]|nr:branched-chain amino acid ABC transporter permease [Tepidisphaeraceae bacterium]